MAFSSLFTLLDDIAAVLDDVSIMTKIAAKKTTGVIGDDLALNANQVSGKNILPEQELPIVWAVAKGSILNKAILIPLALLLSIYLPQAITVLLIIGGVYLCFEGVEKLLHKFLRSDGHEEAGSPAETLDEKTKIKGAIRTDFILSAEIIIIALGVVERYDAVTQSLVMAAIGVGMTAFVYGLVGVIVKLDDLGMFLMKKDSGAAKTLGRGLIAFMPWFMRTLSVVGTLAMFLVGGGLIVHNFAPLHHFLEARHWADGLAGNIAGLVTGLVSGAIVCAVVLPLLHLANKSKSH